MSLDGKTYLIAGAGKADGIGYKTAQTLAAEGARVALADLDATKLPELARALDNPDRHAAFEFDATSESSVSRLMQDVLARFGKLHGVVVTSGSYVPQPFLDTTHDVWKKVFEINAHGAFLVSQAAARAMLSTGGRIVVVSSLNGVRSQLNAAAYGAAKAAVNHMVRYAAIQLAKYNVTINAVCPGSTKTSMFGDDEQKITNAIKGNLELWRLPIPLGHMADPEDQAAMISFLLGKGGRHITGQVICVDGGQTA
jgi:NAD(P)-dependent dehydrogenase (short-subunit alcohol dehydrogenase family)